MNGVWVCFTIMGDYGRILFNGGSINFTNALKMC